MSAEQSRICLWRTSLDPFSVIGRCLAFIKGKRSVSLELSICAYPYCYLEENSQKNGCVKRHAFLKAWIQLTRLSSRTVTRAVHGSACVPEFCPTPRVLCFPVSTVWWVENGTWLPTSASLCSTDISDVYWQEYFSKGNLGDLVFI